jgi:hypothetical protein
MYIGNQYFGKDEKLIDFKVIYFRAIVPIVDRRRLTEEVTG